MRNTPPRSIIAVEGADRAGKATQVKKIIDYLRKCGIPAETLDYPQYDSPWGGMAGNYLHGKYGPIRELPPEYSMIPYMNDRKYHHDRVVRGWLDAGKWVVFDRYSYSNIFSVAKCPKDVWEEKIQFLEKAEFEWWNLPRPDYNFYLYLPPEVSYALRNVGSKNTGDTSAENAGADIHEKDFTLQRDVTEAYRYLTQRRPKEWSFVDQMRDGVRMPADAVFDLKIKPIIDRMIKGME